MKFHILFDHSLIPGGLFCIAPLGDQWLTISLIPVCRAWPILTRSWVRQQYGTSGAGAQKPNKNRQVRQGTTALTFKLQNLRGAQVRYLTHLKMFLGAPQPCSAIWPDTRSKTSHVVILHDLLSTTPPSFYALYMSPPIQMFSRYLFLQGEHRIKCL